MKKIVIPDPLDEDQKSLIRETLNREVEPGKVLWVTEEEAEELKAVLGNKLLESLDE